MAPSLLQSALERINGGVKERAQGLIDLNHILRQKTSGSRLASLKEEDFHGIYETLLSVAASERGSLIKQSTKTTRSAAENRLSKLSGNLRLAIETGVRSIRMNTVRPLLDLLTESFHLPNGSLCEPVALDYAKSLHALLRYQAHIEHLSPEYWWKVVTFCVDFLKDAQPGEVEDDIFSGNESFDPNAQMSKLSYRSTKSYAKESNDFQGSRSLIKQVSEEIAVSLRLLTSVPNLPLNPQVRHLAWSLVEFLRTGSATVRSHLAAFAALGSVLAWTTTEDTNLTLQLTPSVIRLVRNFWPLKNSALKGEMLSILLRLQPYISHSLRDGDNSTLLPEIAGLLDSIRHEYGRRSDRGQLQLDDLRLGSHTRQVSQSAVHLNVLELHQTGAQSEQNWAVVTLMAFLYGELLHSSTSGISSESVGPENDEDSERPTKRLRISQDLSTELEKLLSDSDSGTTGYRVSALQTVAFLSLQEPLRSRELARIVSAMAKSMSDGSSVIASWALLSLACSAFVKSSTSACLQDSWASIWQQACRAISHTGSCRAACFLMNAMIERRLVPESFVIELIQATTHAMETNGPSVFADSVLQVLRTLISQAQLLAPASGVPTQETVSGWLFRLFTTSRLCDRQTAASVGSVDVEDVLDILSGCINRPIELAVHRRFAAWDLVAQTWLACQDSHQLISYLLLMPSERRHLVLDRGTDAGRNAEGSHNNLTSSTIQAATLSHFLNETQLAKDLLRTNKKTGANVLTSDAFKNLCAIAVITMCLSFGVELEDNGRQKQLQREAEALINLIPEFMRDHVDDEDNGDEETIDIALSYLSQPCMQSNEMIVKAPQLARMVTILSAACSSCLNARRQSQQSMGTLYDDDMMDDDRSLSQNSRQAPSDTLLDDLGNAYHLAHSKAGFRSTVALQVFVLDRLFNEVGQLNPSADELSSSFVDYIQTLPIGEIFGTNFALSCLRSFGFHLAQDDAERLLEHMTDTLLTTYRFSRSEVALGAVLDIMANIPAAWTEEADNAIAKLGEETYTWYSSTALKNGLLSPDVQRRFATLLLRIARSNTEYPKGGIARSVRTVLFNLVEVGSVRTQFFLSEKLSSIFELFVLSEHEAMFVDLQESLPTDSDSTEGMAMRLLFLSRLAAAWHTLLRQCVYYMFETAGQVESSLGHAKRCISDVATALSFDTSQTLFELFAPQLLHTWLDEHALSKIPFGAFQYPSLKHLLSSNKAEITAQLFMCRKDSELLFMSNTLQQTKKDLLLQSFAKTVAYCICEDVSKHGSDDDTSPTERAMRSVLSSKEQWKPLFKDCFPAIAGYFFLSLRNDETLDQWLDRSPLYVGASESLEEMRGYSYSVKDLPPSQQPSFKAPYLAAQLERLCRRVSLDPSKPWDSSSLLICVRVLLDSTEGALGPLHSCSIVRKIRLLVAMAGDVALSGYCLETLIGSLRPFLSDSHCADDILGVLKFLFHRGQNDLRTRPKYLFATLALVLLQLRQHIGSRHQSIIQESQHRTTVKKMDEFYAWLISFAREALAEVPTATRDVYETMVTSLSQLELPGNGRLGTAESDLLLTLLDAETTRQGYLNETSRLEALAILTRGFQAPRSSFEDCLGSGEACTKYQQALWELTHLDSLDDNFKLWAGGAIGRAFVATGTRPTKFGITHPILGGGSRDMHDSQAAVANVLVKGLQSRSRQECSISEYTLRCVQAAFGRSQTPNDGAAFQNCLPEGIAPVLGRGPHGYVPGSQRVNMDNHDSALVEALAVLPESSLGRWSTSVALALCRYAQQDPIVGSLTAMIPSVDGCAIALLPAMIHIMLQKDLQHSGELRTLISASINDHFSARSKSLTDKQQFWVDLLLYLRSCQHPEGSTKADNLRWLEVDWPKACAVAEQCGRSTAALLFAESVVPSRSSSSRRSSSRTSQAQLAPVQVSDELLSSIYRHLDEPDSFYGIKQASSLVSVLERLDHEGEGFKALMFRSARVESQMIASHDLAKAHDAGMVRSLAAMELNCINFALMRSGTESGSPERALLFDTARKLQQWDVPAPSCTIYGNEALYATLQGLSLANDLSTPLQRLRDSIHHQTRSAVLLPNAGRSSLAWLINLGCLIDMHDLLTAVEQNNLDRHSQHFSDRHSWMYSASFSEFQAILSTRETVFGVLAENKPLLESYRVGAKQLRILQATALQSSAELACLHGKLQNALASSTRLSDLAVDCKDLGINIEAASKQVLASALAQAGEISASTSILKEISDLSDLDTQTITVGRSGILAKLGHELETARLEKPEDILISYLKPAIKDLHNDTRGQEAGDVFFEFASFCDRQLQNPSNMEEFQRITKLYHSLEEETSAIRRSVGDVSQLRGQAEKNYKRSMQWLKIDKAEYNRQVESRNTWTEQSLLNYMLALRASDDHDICVLRLFALWLENDESPQANAVVAKHLQTVPSWKFIVLLNQLMSRLKHERTVFQQSLSTLATRICLEHPYHSLHHLFAMTRSHNIKRDDTAAARRSAGMDIRSQIENHSERGDLLKRIFSASRLYMDLAYQKHEGRRSSKITLKELPAAQKVARSVPSLRIPPATFDPTPAPDGTYDSIPEVVRFENAVQVMGGISAPKALTAVSSDGSTSKQLFKGGHDDLRQDAIMEQVFGEVSKMLRNHRATRQRKLRIRTYKVVPLSHGSGIIEFVKNSASLNEIFQDLHQRYYPQDMSHDEARRKIEWGHGNQHLPQQTLESRVKEFRKVCDRIHPVLRHFFFERFNDPDDWFEKRTAYTRTTAAISILGHVLGLGDRHLQNILLDKENGDAVHIDLGVAFEAGRLLPIPELVPFRLTRDVVDGMGVTGTEGVFRRCCEFTLDALREDKDSIMTLLNVLRYDPLYSWTVSAVRAKRMQDAQTDAAAAAGVEADGELVGSVNKKKEQEAGEAERALSVVEKKLAKTLSTAAAVNELIQQARDVKNLATLFCGWSAWY